MVEKIISGGQTGADQAGLEAAYQLGLQTGGTAPPKFMTEDGPRVFLLTTYNLIEGGYDPKIYPRRTVENVKNSDGTLWFGKSNSPSGKLTINTAMELGKYLLVITNPSNTMNTHLISAWLTIHNIKVLNVAGNRESKSPGIYDTVLTLLKEALTPPMKIPLTAPDSLPDKVAQLGYVFSDPPEVENCPHMLYLDVAYLPPYSNVVIDKP